MLLWMLQFVLAAVFRMTGRSKFAGAPVAVHVFNGFGTNRRPHRCRSRMPESFVFGRRTRAA